MRTITDIGELTLKSGYWYLATPYTKYKGGIEAAYMDAWDISDLLRGGRVKHFSPIIFTHEIAMATGLNPLDRDFWMRVDQPYMEKAHGLIVGCMEGWEDSIGVGAECAYFAGAEKPTLLLDPNKFWGMS